MRSDSFCFHEVYILMRPPDAIIEPRLRQISKEEGVEHLVAHMRGVRHPADADSGDGRLPIDDPIGNSIRAMALREDYHPLNEQEAKEYEQLLLAGLKGYTQAVRDTLGRVQVLRDPHLNPVQTIATIAATKGNAEMLEFAFEKGAQLDRNLSVAINMGKELNAEMQQIFQRHSKAVTEHIDILRAEQERGIDASINPYWHPDHPLNWMM